MNLKFEKGELLECDAPPDPRCKDCYGTGIVGRRVNKDGSRTELHCRCKLKAMGKEVVQREVKP